MQCFNAALFTFADDDFAHIDVLAGRQNGLTGHAFSRILVRLGFRPAPGRLPPCCFWLGVERLESLIQASRDPLFCPSVACIPPLQQTENKRKLRASTCTINRLWWNVCFISRSSHTFHRIYGAKFATVMPEFLSLIVFEDREPRSLKIYRQFSVNWVQSRPTPAESGMSVLLIL